jgi:hypothetical protein
MKSKAYLMEMLNALPASQRIESERQLAVDTYEKQSSLEGDVYGAAGGSLEKSKAQSREMSIVLPGDREWVSQFAVDTYEKQSLLEGDKLYTKMHSWGCATRDGVCANASSFMFIFLFSKNNERKKFIPSSNFEIFAVCRRLCFKFRNKKC